MTIQLRFTNGDLEFWNAQIEFEAELQVLDANLIGWLGPIIWRFD